MQAIETCRDEVEMVLEVRDGQFIKTLAVKADRLHLVLAQL